MLELAKRLLAGTSAAHVPTSLPPLPRTLPAARGADPQRPGWLRHLRRRLHKRAAGQDAADGACGAARCQNWQGCKAVTAQRCPTAQRLPAASSTSCHPCSHPRNAGAVQGGGWRQPRDRSLHPQVAQLRQQPALQGLLAQQPRRCGHTGGRLHWVLLCMSSAQPGCSTCCLVQGRLVSGMRATPALIKRINLCLPFHALPAGPQVSEEEKQAFNSTVRAAAGAPAAAHVGWRFSGHLKPPRSHLPALLPALLLIALSLCRFPQVPIYRR